MLVRARSDEYIQQLVASKAIIAASSKKKDGTTIVNKGLDLVKSLCTSNNEKIMARALGGLCRLSEAGRRSPISPGKGSGLRRGAAEGLSYLTQDVDGKKKLVYNEPDMRTPSELGKSGAQNGMYGIISTLVKLPNSHGKQENPPPKRIEQAKVAKQHIPEEHKLGDENLTNERIGMIGQLGTPAAWEALSKTGSLNRREPRTRVMIAFCKHPTLRGQAGRHGDSRAPWGQPGRRRGEGRCRRPGHTHLGQEPEI